MDNFSCSILEKSASWEVPSYEVLMGDDKKKDYAIVIPVINEGQRIQSLISKMFLLELHKKADVIIVDGGSTDGSLELQNLKEKGIRFLLKKTGSGKLSSQLRCAYAFALTQGYKGIVTIDGNDKDDPKDIPSFIEALENGYDFVQASRFVKGGIGINTPLSRLLAIKFIHAPFLSLASGFKWTDTTQGFRGYSSRILLDPKVAPFRDVFSGYELLAYLSYRIPKLGYNCIELPTSRIYPKDEVPTKISWLRGNMDLMAVLLKTVMGKYNPIEN